MSHFITTCIMAARPKTLPAAIIPVWAGCALAWKKSGELDFFLAICTLLSAIFIQVATNFFNDAIDSRKGADTKQRIGPQRVTASGLMSEKQVSIIACIFLGLAMIAGAFLIQARGWQILVIGIPSLFLAYGYTGGPFPLAYRGMGELFVILFFGIIAVAGTVFVQLGSVPKEAYLLGGQTGLLSAVLISINNLRDHDEDLSTNKRTLAVKFGKNIAKWVIWLEIKAAAMLGLLWLMCGEPRFVVASAVILMLGTRILFGIFFCTDTKSHNRLLALSALQLVLFAVAFHILAAF